MGARVVHTVNTVRSDTLGQLEEHFGACLPQTLFPKAPDHTNSRDRLYTRWRTFWSLLWQGFNPKASGREVVRQIQALFDLHDGPSISEPDGAYCRAKTRLPVSEFPKALAATAQAADRGAPPLRWLQNHHVKAADGTILTLNDTPKNRATYPALHSPEPNSPLLRLVVLFSLASGAILSLASGNLHTAELPLFSRLLDQLVPGDILLADRGFANFILLALLQKLNRGIDFIGRSVRHVDGRRRLKRLGPQDGLIQWQRSPNPSLWLPLAQWLALPKQMTVRMVRGSLYCKGFRVRQVTLVTTLLDPQLYPAQEILQAYLRRWRLEMCLDDLKTTLEMEMRRSRSPERVQREVYAHLIAHNLIRYTMAQAATQQTVPLERISFKGTLDALRQFTHAISQARTNKKRRPLWTKLLETLAADLVPDHPGRREPRAVKRKKNKYPRLDAPRRKFRDHLKRNVRLTKARLRKLSPK
jgi:hypothetical protein